MTFYAVYDKATGELYSTGTELGDAAVLAERGLTAVELPEPKPGQPWNAKAHRFDPAPPPTPVAEQVNDLLADDPDFAALTPAQKALIAKFAPRLSAATIVEPPPAG